MNDWVTITDGVVTAAINPLGAELSSLTDADGAEWMTDADPAFWAGRSPLLFPIVGALNGGRYRLGGVDYAMPQHGFARRREFALVERSDAQVRFRLTDDADSRAMYPFAFALDAEYRVAGGALTIVCSVTNTGNAPMPCSFGYHPAFAWPLPGEAGKAGHFLRFEAEEPGMLARLDGGLIAGVDRVSPLVDGRVLPLDDDVFAGDALVWEGLASRAVDYCGRDGTGLRVTFPDAEKLGVWTKPGAGFLCIEPWWGIADPVGFDGEIWEKPGVMVLAPGKVRVFAMGVALAT